MSKFINYPDSKKLTEVVFKLNSDDFSPVDIRKISAYIKSLGYKYKYYRTYSDTKLMSWGVYKIQYNELVTWEENIILAEKWVNNALK
jgi:hypothetical protein